MRNTLRNPVSEALLRLLAELEDISYEHDEITDTDVREAIHLSLNHYFVWGNDLARFPSNFGMDAADGDRRIGEALLKFIVEAVRTGGEAPLGSQRLALIQDASVRTATGRLYDEFMGHRDSPLPRDSLPEGYFLPGLGKKL